MAMPVKEVWGNPGRRGWESVEADFNRRYHPPIQKEPKPEEPPAAASSTKKQVNLLSIYTKTAFLGLGIILGSVFPLPYFAAIGMLILVLSLIARYRENNYFFFLNFFSYLH